MHAASVFASSYVFVLFYLEGLLPWCSPSPLAPAPFLPPLQRASLSLEGRDLSKALIYECSRIMLGVVFLLHSFSRTVVLGFPLAPQAISFQVLGHSSSVVNMLHPMEWAFSQIGYWLLTPTSFVPPMHQRILQTSLYIRCCGFLDIYVKHYVMFFYLKWPRLTSIACLSYQSPSWDFRYVPYTLPGSSISILNSCLCTCSC